MSLILEEHENNGHFGLSKCLTYLLKFYYRPKMCHNVRCIISGCELSQNLKSYEQLHDPIHSVLPNGPNEIVCMDIIGPPPSSRGGVTQLLVFVDAFSKHVFISFKATDYDSYS